MTSVVLGVCHDGAEAGSVRPEEAGKEEAPIALGEALVESAPALVDTPEVGWIGGGVAEAPL